MNIESEENRLLLAQKGWNSFSTSYLKKWKKEELIEHIRILEHNWAGEIWGSNLIRKRLEKKHRNISEFYIIQKEKKKNLMETQKKRREEKVVSNI